MTVDEQTAAAQRMANALGLPLLTMQAAMPSFRSAACRNPQAGQAELIEQDLARATRHPFKGARPTWSGYCLFPDRCECSCHGPDRGVDGIDSPTLSLGELEIGDPVAVADSSPDDCRCRCGATWRGFSIAHCAVCHLTFTTVGNFDHHLFRDGCRTEAELRDKGYEPNAAGHWRKPMPEGRMPWAVTR
jgi:hypothetical protein